MSEKVVAGKYARRQKCGALRGDVHAASSLQCASPFQQKITTRLLFDVMITLLSGYTYVNNFISEVHVYFYVHL